MLAREVGVSELRLVRPGGAGRARVALVICGDDASERRDVELMMEQLELLTD